MIIIRTISTGICSLPTTTLRRISTIIIIIKIRSCVIFGFDSVLAPKVRLLLHLRWWWWWWRPSTKLLLLETIPPIDHNSQENVQCIGTHHRPSVVDLPVQLLWSSLITTCHRPRCQQRRTGRWGKEENDHQFRSVLNLHQIYSIFNMPRKRNQRKWNRISPNPISELNHKSKFSPESWFCGHTHTTVVGQTWYGRNDGHLMDIHSAGPDRVEYL